MLYIMNKYLQQISMTYICIYIQSKHGKPSLQFSKIQIQTWQPIYQIQLWIYQFYSQTIFMSKY